MHSHLVSKRSSLAGEKNYVTGYTSHYFVSLDSCFIVTKQRDTFTYDHIHEKIRDPVRSPLVKLVRGRLVVRSVTTGESRLLYVLSFLLM